MSQIENLELSPKANHEPVCYLTHNTSEVADLIESSGARAVYLGYADALLKLNSIEDPDSRAALLAYLKTLGKASLPD